MAIVRHRFMIGSARTNQLVLVALVGDIESGPDMVRYIMTEYRTMMICTSFDITFP